MTFFRFVRYAIEAGALLIGFLTIPLLPRRLVVAVSNGLGSLAYLLAKRDRTTAEANVKLVYGDELNERQVRAMVRESFSCFALVLLDLFWFSLFTVRRIRKYVHADAEYCKACKDGAFILLTAHFGNWEALGLMTALGVERIVSVAAPLENRFADRVLKYMRRGTGQVVVGKSGAVRVLMKELKAGNKAALVMDQNTLPEDGGLFVDLFGVPAPVSMAPAGIMLHAGCDAGFVCGIPDGKGHYEAKLTERFVYEDCKSLTREDLTIKFVNALERAVSMSPQHWLWAYKRWKFIPEGAEMNKFPFYSRKV